MNTAGEQAVRQSLGTWNPFAQGGCRPVVCICSQAQAVDVMRRMLTRPEDAGRPKGAAALLTIRTLASLGRQDSRRVIPDDA